jgi:uncharacterized protein (DUF488 family)
VTALADIRSSPASRFSPHFNKAALAATLSDRGIAYLFLGRELGGRPARAELYTRGTADYEKMGASPEFAEGLRQLEEAAKQHRVALMCAEANPLDCHRFLLVARVLAERGADMRHILPEGSIITQEQAEDRLLEAEGLADPDLLARSRAARLAEAYRVRCSKAAYQQIEHRRK